jgi:hypothetical protein
VLDQSGTARITIWGAGFDDVPEVQVNGQLAAIDSAWGQKRGKTISFPLPVGAGAPVPVQVSFTRSDSYSLPVNYLSYASPRINSIYSVNCTQTAPNTLSSCPRDAGVNTVVLTIDGENFGASGSSVYIGGNACSNVVHDTAQPHARLRCSLPSGQDQNSLVVLIQANGVANNQSLNSVGSSAITISYATCQSGQNLDANAQCSSCPIGSASNGFACVPCDAGTYRSSPSSLGCIDCPAGKYQDQTNSTACKNCGLYNVSSTGATSCSVCPDGQYNDNNQAASVCNLCSAGKYRIAFNVGGPGVCTNCSAGYYNPSTGQSTCTPATVGNYVSYSGATSTTLCRVGTYSNALASTGCTACPIGFSQARSGETGCVICTAGRYVNNTGSGSCIDCLAGSFSNILGSSSCTLCPAGTYQNLNTSTTCYACLSGTYNRKTGFSGASCTNCDMGTYSKQVANSPVGPTICIDCEPGRFNPFGANNNFSESQTGQADCQDAGVGYFAAGNRSIAQTSCAPGTFSAFLGQSSCDICHAVTIILDSISWPFLACLANSLCISPAIFFFVICRENSPSPRPRCVRNVR